MRASLAKHKLPTSRVEELIVTFEALIHLTKQSEKLTTRLKSYQDRQEDFDAWRLVSKAAAEVNTEALNASQVYNYIQFKAEVEQLWVALRTRFEGQPLSFLSTHRIVSREIEAQRLRIVGWLDKRRDDFDSQCQAYQKLLASVHIEANLRVPFDKERPAESHAALMLRVKEYLDKHFNSLYATLKSSLQVIRYGIQVQGLNLSDAEARANQTLKLATQVKEQIYLEMISDKQRFKSDVLKPLIELMEEQKKLEEEVQSSIRQRPAEGTEKRLMELFQTTGTGQEVDLRELIIRLLDQGEGTVSLNALMRDLESLFQKNLVDIQIKLSRRERPEVF